MIAVILAGGKSSRMGQDKALLPFNGHSSLAKYQYEKLTKLFSKVYISAKNDKFDFLVDIIEDKYEDSSPLVALISIFETINEDELFMIAVDSPFIDSEIIESLLKANHSDHTVIAKNRGKIEPLCGIYKRSILPLAKEQLKHGDHKLQNLLQKAKVSFVEFNDDKKFLNLNRPHEYEEAMSLFP